MMWKEASPQGRFAKYDESNAAVLDQVCDFCNKPITAGHRPCLVPVAPADDEERSKMLQGRAYNAVAKVVHEHCIHGCEPDVICETCSVGRAMRAEGAFVWTVCMNGHTVRT